MTEDEKEFWFNWIVDEIKNDEELIEAIDKEFDDAYDPVNGKGLDGSGIGNFIKTITRATKKSMLKHGFKFDVDDDLVLKSRIHTELIEYVLYRNDQFVLEECL